MATEAVDYLIIGGGPAGTMAAETIRQHDQNGRIVILNLEPYRLYSRISLPYYIKGTKTKEQLFLRGEQQYKDAAIDLLAGVVVERVDTSRKSVTTQDGRTFFYKKLLVSAGGTPIPWDLAGSEKEGVVRLNTLDNSDEIIRLLPSTKEIVIVGGGFISLEFCGIALAHQKKATVLVRDPYYWSSLLDEISGTLIVKSLEKHGISVRTNQEAAEVTGEARVTGIKTKSNTTLPAQMVGVGIGVKRNLDFLAGSPLAVNKGIITNEFLESSVPDVWAAGDIAEFEDIIIGKRHMLGNWSNATDQGRRAGLNMSGQREPFQAVSAYSITMLDLNVTFLGDTQPEDAQVITRGDKVNNFGRIFMREGRLVGATLINRIADKMPLINIIRQRTPVTSALQNILADHTKPIAVVA